MPQIITNTVITSQTVAGSQLQIRDELYRLHPLFIGNSPGDGTCRKISPLLTGSKLGRPVGTNRQSSIITIFVIIQCTSEERSGSVGSTFITGALIGSPQSKILQRCLCRYRNRKELCTHKRIIVLRMVNFLSQHYIDIVRLIKRVTIGQRICQTI